MIAIVFVNVNRRTVLRWTIAIRWWMPQNLKEQLKLWANIVLAVCKHYLLYIWKLVHVAVSSEVIRVLSFFQITLYEMAEKEFKTIFLKNLFVKII